MTIDTNKAIDSARRRLARGMFAVPTIIPVTTGAQTAMSSAMGCFNRSSSSEQTNLNTNPAAPIHAGAAWGVKTYKSGNSLYFKGDDIKEWGVLNDIDSSKFQGDVIYDLLTNQPANVTLETEPVGAASLNLTYEQGRSPQFAILSVGTTATVEGSHRVMWGSCWTSFAVGK